MVNDTDKKGMVGRFTLLESYWLFNDMDKLFIGQGS
jgi:hypothetical protein